MKRIIHLKITPLDEADPTRAEGKGATLLSALADLESNVRSHLNPEIDFASAGWDLNELVCELQQPGGRWEFIDMATPETNCRIDRLDPANED